MRLYRIKQLNENTFIPQVAKPSELFLFWYGIDLKRDYDFLSESTQKEYCSKSTLEEACLVIEEHKRIRKIKKRYPKYHRPCSAK